MREGMSSVKFSSQRERNQKNFGLLDVGTETCAFFFLSAKFMTKSFVQCPVPGLPKVARKLKVDCVPAMIGWDNKTVRWSVPV